MNYFINIVSNLFVYFSAPLAIRYIIFRRPIHRKWVAILVLIPIFVTLSIMVNIQREHLREKLYQEHNIPYSRRTTSTTPPILWLSMVASFFILTKNDRNSKKGDSTESICDKNNENIKQPINGKIITNQENKDCKQEADNELQQVQHQSKTILYISLAIISISLLIIISISLELASDHFKRELNQAGTNTQNPVVTYQEEQSHPQSDSEEAMQYLVAAQQGDSEAQFVIGWMYAVGKGVSKDNQAALKWFLVSAEQGNASGQLGVGWMYKEGHGVPQDYYKAMKWFRLSAEQGDEIAQWHLGWMYANGQGVTQNFEEACSWWIVSAAKNHPPAKEDLETIKNEMDSYEIQNAQHKANIIMKRIGQ